jgi:hypothetical protein
MFYVLMAETLPILGIVLMVILFSSVSWVFASIIAVFNNKET